MLTSLVLRGQINVIKYGNNYKISFIICYINKRAFASNKRPLKDLLLGN
jgi:hypothetical protein